MTVTKKELAELAGFTYQTLYNINRELPEDEKLFVSGEGGKGCDLGAFIQRWVKYNVGDALDGVKDLDQIKAAHEKVKTRKTELEVSRMEGTMIDTQDAMRLWGGMINTAKQNLLHLPGIVTPMIEGETRSEVIKDIIDREIRKCLEDIAETKLPGFDDAAEEEKDNGD